MDSISLVSIFLLITAWLIAIIRRQLLLVYWWQVKEFRFDRFVLWIKTKEGRNQIAFKFILIKLIIFLFSILIKGIILIYFGVLLFETYKFFEEIKNRNLRKPVFAIRARNILIISSLSLALSVFVIAITQNLQHLLILDILSYLFPILGIVVTQAIFNRTLLKETDIARRKLHKVKPLVVAITGSQGKSTTKHLLYHLLASHFNTLETPFSHNTPFGIVRAINTSLKPNTKFFISEMGAYKKGEVKNLTQITPPAISVITGISPQHIGLFGSMNNLIEAKYEIAQSLDSDQPLFVNISQKSTEPIVNKAKRDKKFIKTYALGKKADYYSIIKKQTQQKTIFDFHEQGKTISLETNITINHLIENLTGAIAIARYLDVPFTKIKQTVKNIPYIERAITTRNLGNLKVIDDSYNSTPQGFESALTELEKQKGKSLVILTSGISELGEIGYEVHKRLGKKMNKVDTLFITNSDLKKAFKEGGVRQIVDISDPSFFIKLQEKLAMDNTALLIEGRIPSNIYNFVINNNE